MTRPAAEAVHAFFHAADGPDSAGAAGADGPSTMAAQPEANTAAGAPVHAADEGIPADGIEQRTDDEQNRAGADRAPHARPADMTRELT